MKVKQTIVPYKYSIQGEYAEIDSVQFCHYCPKCNICIDHKMKNIYDLKYCFNCGQKLDTREIELVARPIEPIKIKCSDIFSESEPINLYGRMVGTVRSKDLSKYL